MVAHRQYEEKNDTNSNFVFSGNIIFFISQISVDLKDPHIKVMDC
jgi:hypothetical protein